MSPLFWKLEGRVHPGELRHVWFHKSAFAFVHFLAPRLKRLPCAVVLLTGSGAKLTKMLESLSDRIVTARSLARVFPLDL
jgi:hypothetical protein